VILELCSKSRDDVAGFREADVVVNKTDERSRRRVNASVTSARRSEVLIKTNQIGVEVVRAFANQRRLRRTIVDDRDVEPIELSEKSSQ
jgi:hypothetical protein